MCYNPRMDLSLSHFASPSCSVCSNGGKWKDVHTKSRLKTPVIENQHQGTIQEILEGGIEIEGRLGNRLT